MKDNNSPSLFFRIQKEAKEVFSVTLYFFCCFLFFLILKKLLLAEYHLHTVILGKALLSALIIAKVVIVLEHLSLSKWCKEYPRCIRLLWRAGIGTFLVAIVLVIERLIHFSRESESFREAVTALSAHADRYHIMASCVVVFVSFCIYNLSAQVREYLPEKSFLSFFKDKD